MPVYDIFRAIKFRVLVFQDPFLTRTLLHKNTCSFLNNGQLLKIQIVPETRDRAPHDSLHYLILGIY